MLGVAFCAFAALTLYFGGSLVRTQVRLELRHNLRDDSLTKLYIRRLIHEELDALELKPDGDAE